MAGRKKNPRSQSPKGDTSSKTNEVTVDTIAEDSVEELKSDVIETNETAKDLVAEIDTPDEFFEDEAAETLESASSADVISDVEEVSKTDEASSDGVSDPIVAPVPVPPVVEQKSSAMPTIFGGVVAACIGAGGLYFADMQGWLGHSTGDTTAFEEQLKAQSEEIAALKLALTAATEQTATVQAALPDLTPVQTALDGLATSDTETATAIAALTTSLTETRDSLTATSTRLGELEVQPIPKAELPKEVVAAYETQLAEILATIEGRFTEMQTTQTAVVTGIQTEIDARLAEIDTAQTTAAAMEEAANVAAETAKANTAAAKIVASLETGEAFADPLTILADVDGLTISAALTDAATDGVASVTDLQKSFPDAARVALSASAGAAVEDGSMSPLASFFATQLGARSLEPREGNSPDAILSRAEAAVGQADLDAAMAELGNLPEAGQAAFADWIASATALRDAKIAATDLVAQLNNK